jgi:phosphoglycolate phosphatase (TIGR01487 family)
MRYVALATDYDGTLAHHGRVSPETIQALERLRDSGRRLLLVTGRELPDLKATFERLDLFDRVIAENGALLYRPESNEEHSLTEAPPEKFIQRLKERGVPFSVGQGIVATNEPHESEVLAAIKDLGLELHVIFNKGAVMVLPSGVNKATGLHCALEELGISEHNVVAIGDAENDHAFLSACEFGVAVANALENLKARADLVTEGARGAGVEELIGQIIEDDLERYDSRLSRHSILLGHTLDDSKREISVPPHRGSVLIAGPSGSGKSTVATALLERLIEQKYQFCLIDPEGDYETLPSVIVLGSASNPPNPAEVLKALENAGRNVVVNLLAVPLADRPLFCASLLPNLLESRARTARPHFLIFDEAHHVLPSSWRPASALVPQAMNGFVLITVHPDWVAQPALETVDCVVAVGKNPGETFQSLAKVIHQPGPTTSVPDLDPGTAAVWRRADEKSEVLVVAIQPSQIDRRRHTRKYAEGELPPDRSFYFRGPEGKLNLRAQNLMMFVQIAAGVDDETWLHHLRGGEYSKWFARYIKDDELAAEAAAVEEDSALDPQASRRAITEAIEKRYTAAA